MDGKDGFVKNSHKFKSPQGEQTRSRWPLRLKPCHGIILREMNSLLSRLWAVRISMRRSEIWLINLDPTVGAPPRHSGHFNTTLHLLNGIAP